MNGTTVSNHLKSQLGIKAQKVVGEQSSNLRFYTIYLDPKDAGRAHEVRDAVVKLIEAKGFSGGCDILQFGFSPLGSKKLA